MRLPSHLGKKLLAGGRVMRCLHIKNLNKMKYTNFLVKSVCNNELNSLNRWKGHCYWGFSDAKNTQTSFPKPNKQTKVIVVSRTEDRNVRSKLENSGFSLIEVAGAGYKILSVAMGLADAYILSRGSTYKWDTCAPQAILYSLGGGILDFQKFTTNLESTDLDLKYPENEDNHANRGGLIAYREKSTLDLLCKSLALSTKL